MGRNSSKNEEMKNSTKSKIIDGSILFFAKYGYLGTKIGDLAKFIGISQGLLYRYFSSKEALFEEITTNWNNQRDKDYDSLVQAPLSPDEKIRTLTKHLEEGINKDHQLACFFTIQENRCLITGLDEVFQNWSAPPIRMLSDIILEGQKEGVCYSGNPLQMAVSYWGLFSAICRDYISTNGDISNYDFNMLNRLLLKEEGK
ncbi:MAG: TetR/AcrR family transcriptional regulator [Anaeroplasmataceae bacterium]|nr:TetR/AcrR family transcriptional regulator [Anaeroplasmataceae bacterium]